MSVGDDDLEIRSGGLIAVDTATLRSAAARLALIADRGDDIRRLLARATIVLNDAGVWRFAPTRSATDAADRARRLADDLRRMADLYEIVEQDAAADLAAASGESSLAARLRADAAGRLLRDPLLWAPALRAQPAEQSTRQRELQEQFGGGLPGWDAVVGVATAAVLGAVGAAGRGTVSPEERLSGPRRVGVPRLLSQTTAAPPSSLAQLTDRLPSGDGRVRVERYSMPDGSRRYVAYVAGTRAMFDESDPWNMYSNGQLYLGQIRSPSYDITVAALARAGVRRGDSVTLVGHSQGALITTHLVLSGRYDVPTHITLGSPIQADLGDHTLDVALRHGDDIVAALAGGGLATGAGAPGSFVAGRTTHATFVSGEEAMTPHGQDEYRKTAQMLDASTDPRMDAVRARLAEFDDAVETDVFEFGAVTPAQVLSASAADEG